MMVVAGPSARGHVRLAHPDLLRSGVLARDSLAAGHPRGLAGVGAKFPAAYVDERLVPAVLGHHASNYLLNLAIISDIIVAWYATRSHPAGAPLDAAVLHDHEGFVPFSRQKNSRSLAPDHRTVRQRGLAMSKSYLHIKMVGFKRHDSC
jgi:hypothetical protein